jgi:hypothetical protein
VAAVPLLGSPAQGQWWRVIFAQPLRGPVTLAASFPLQPPGEQPRQVPLATVPDADAQEGEVTLYLAGTGLVEVKTRGLREVPVATQAGGGPRGAALAWRTYRYGRLGDGLFPGGAAEAVPQLRLSRRVQVAGQAPEEVIDRSRLTTYVEPHGRLLHHFAFRAWHWRGRTMTVRLPPGAQPLAVKAYGRWISPLAHAETEGGAVLELQVASGVPVHRFEVVYASPKQGPGWALWSRLEAPVPSLPVRPVAFRRIWRLPPGVLPLTQGGQQRLPGSGSAGGIAGFDFLAGFESHREAQNLNRQRQLLAEADAALRGQFPQDKPWRLGEVLNRLVFDRLKGQTVLVLDAEALRAAGVTVGSRIEDRGSRIEDRGSKKADSSTPIWEQWGLVYVPCREGALLTTRRQEEIWQNSTGQTSPPATVEEAVGEAAVYGHDGSGRFRAAADWLGERDPRSAIRDPRPAPGLAADSSILDPYTDWAAWEPRAGLEEEEVLWVVRQGGLPFLGLALVVALGGVAWGVRRRLSLRWRLRLFLALLAASGLALLWLPPALRELAWWPALAALGGLVLWYVVSTVQSQLRAAPAGGVGKSPSGSGVKAAALLALLGVTGLTGHAAAPAPYPVLLVPDSQVTGKISALVTPGLLQRLEEMSRQGVAGLQGAVLLSADYKGKVAGAGTVWDAEFVVYCFGKEATLTLPLGGVVLKPRGGLGEPAFFAGKPAFPSALPRKQKGFRVPVQVAEPGLYTLSLRFTAAVEESAGERTVQFAIPPLAQSRFTLELPQQARAVLDVSGLGILHLSLDGRLKVELGRVDELRVRWRQPPRPGRRTPAQVQVQEAYLWDLRKPDISLSGILHYTVKNGTVPDLTLALPEGIAVRSVEVRHWPPGDGASAPQLLNKSWELGADHRLRVQLHSPATGGLQMIVELVPRLPARPGALALALPQPVLPRPRNGDKILPGSLAYRLDGLEVRERPEHLSTAEIKPDAFAQSWRRAVRKFSDGGPPTQAYRFQRQPGGPAVLWLTPKPPAVHARQQAAWRVGPDHVDLEAAVTLTAPAENLMLVEWEVPRVHVTEVSGPQVRSWSRTASQVQVWLTGPCARAELRLSGWLPLTPGPNHGRRLDLPCLRLVGVGSQETEVRVAAVGGRALEPVHLRNLAPAPARGGPVPPGTIRYTTTSPLSVYEAAFNVVAPRAEVRTLTQAEIRDRELVVTALLDYTASRGELRTVRVRLRRWYGDEVRVEGPGVVLAGDRRPGQGEYTWTLHLPPGAGRAFTVRLTGKVPLEAASTFAMPEVSDVSGNTVQGRERWLGLSGPEVGVEKVHGLTALANPGWHVRLVSPLARRAVSRLRRAWRIQIDSWQLRLRPRPPAAAPRVRWLLAEQSAAVADGRRWVHEAAYWLFGENAGDFRLELPADAAVLAVSIDGISEVPRPTGEGQLWLSLPGGAGARRLRVRWMYPPDRETPERPNLALPRLRDADGPGPKTPTLVTVHVPPGYQALVGDKPVEDDPALARVEQDLERAGAQFQLSTRLADRVRSQPGDGDALQLRAAQERFYWSCRQAANRLDVARRTFADTDPEYRRLTARQAELLDKNSYLKRRREDLLQKNLRLMESGPLQKIRIEAEKSSRSRAPGSSPSSERTDVAGGTWDLEPLLPVRGRPISWLRETAANPPRLRLRATEGDRTRQAWAASSVIVAALLCAWILSLFPQLLAGLQMIWPEQVLLLGWLLWEVAGLAWVGIGLMALGVGARLFLFTLWGLGHFHPAPPPAGGRASTSSS